MRPVLPLALALGVVLFWTAPLLSAHQQLRPGRRAGLALVIGNASYAGEELPSVRTDRARMAKALKSLDFSVREVEDIKKKSDFVEELATFLRDEKASADDVLVVYYSGHGVQIEGKSFVLGTEARSGSEAGRRLADYSWSIDEIIRDMERAWPVARVLIVDACRNSAFATAARRPSTAFDASLPDTYVLFADVPGKSVPSRSAASLQSPFTAGLLLALETTDTGIEDVFDAARRTTAQLNPDQTPQMLKSVAGENQDLAFIRKRRRAEAQGLAGQIVNEAEALYKFRLWDDFRDKLREARVLSTEPSLSRRLDDELRFAELTSAAEKAERNAKPDSWIAAANMWREAFSLFPARVWTLERAGLAWLMADRLPAAIEALADSLERATEPTAGRISQLLSSIEKASPRGVARVPPNPRPTQAPPTEEFELVAVEQ